MQFNDGFSNALYLRIIFCRVIVKSVKVEDIERDRNKDRRRDRERQRQRHTHGNKIVGQQERKS